MNTLYLIPQADAEFQEAAQWYEEQKPGLGLQFISVIERKLFTIQAHPDRYPKRKQNFREAVVRGFPYSIVYTFNRKRKMVRVLAIFHSHRDPRGKYRR
ncbi:MAG: type II toxin-antitoxin system RelE/ParE family toxin [Cyclobacteriaceae bacterium]